MGVTYDMLSDYELQNMVAKEQERTTKVRAPAPVERSYVQRVEQSPPRTRTAEQVMSSPNKFKNPELERATAALQAEFDALLREGVSSRKIDHQTMSPSRQIARDDDIEAFYSVMNEMRANDNHKRHKSPTRRLIDQKNSTWEHKQLLLDQSRSSRFAAPKYDLHYTTEPGKSYIVQPDGGPLDYNLARKNPIGFYDKVLS